MTKRRLSQDNERNDLAGGSAILCTEPPCEHEWVDVELYPSHVDQLHANVCPQCSINLTSEYWLELHIEEYHDPFREGCKLKCLEFDCPVTFDNSSNRASHLKTYHNYSDKFNYDIIKSGY
ncbi:unnamed protein product [Kluyveromyces dobzhanskii CBS 2104]|uniref:WGS project CCBQ000000000 data, contig 00041 n=1 Tax=Kluyveromyces dobzhanskii CBS 2104 TaxID=1427455 RepID=A0A0A8L2T1_9SACH|nr:unnamed protein product [Kluyveromyces dobzhanskii CBS 2104]